MAWNRRGGVRSTQWGDGVGLFGEAQLQWSGLKGGGADLEVGLRGVA